MRESDSGNFVQERVKRLLNEHRAKLDSLGVESLLLFGSAARGETGPDSDLDVLVCFQSTPTFRRYMELLFFLEVSPGADSIGT